jgi:hypothetical protein
MALKVLLHVALHEAIQNLQSIMRGFPIDEETNSGDLLGASITVRLEHY